jgi:Tol biopolymer transport system component
MDIWVTQVGSGQAVNRTADSTANEFRPTWSPDGQWIAFFSLREGGDYFVMPGVGGIARKVASCLPSDSYASTAGWSPDSTQLVYALGQRAEPWFEILTLTSGVSRKLPLPARPRHNTVVDISWSPDGRWLAYVRSLSSNAATSELWLTRISDGQSIQLTDGSKKDRSPSWSPDSRGLYFISNRGGTNDLWRYTIDREGRPEGAPQQVTAGIEISHGVLSPNGQKLAYATGRRIWNAFRAPLVSDRPATWADTTQLTFDEAEIESIDLSSDGRIIVSSDRSGNWDLYSIPASGGNLQQLTTDPSLDAGPRWKPDGSEITFYSSRAGHREVWIMPIEGGPARQLTKGESESLFPSWSPDGREIVMYGNGLSVVPAQGGEGRQLTSDARDIIPDWSPDGQWIVFSSTRIGGPQLWRVPASGGQPEQLTKGSAYTARWSPDGKQIYFIGFGDRANNIWTLSLGNREERPVTALTGRRGELGSLGLATDGRSIYFTWGETRGDIWVADIVQPPSR